MFNVNGLCDCAADTEVHAEHLHDFGIVDVNFQNEKGSILDLTHKILNKEGIFHFTPKVVYTFSSGALRENHIVLIFCGFWMYGFSRAWRD